jgi:hypothetical protein
MSQAKTQKTSRNIPEHVKRAVKARDGDRCRNCGVETEFLHYDHIFPFDLGGPTTAENIQRLCPTCNTSKGNKIQCAQCRHWLSPEHALCTQCGARFPYSKHSQTLAGRLENLFQRVGKVVVVGGGALLLLLLLSGVVYVYRRVGGSSQAAEQSAHVQTVVNDSFTAAPNQPASFQITVPPDARNARVVGGYKVTSGPAVSCYVVDASLYQPSGNSSKPVQALTAREDSKSYRLRQALGPGTYYLLFFSPGGAAGTTVAAEFYLKYD